jgi:hypothetical protein
MKKSANHPEDMSAAELADATKQFDQPFIFEQSRPMTRTERAEECKLRRGRPKIGKGARKISIHHQSQTIPDAGRPKEA